MDPVCPGARVDPASRVDPVARVVEVALQVAVRAAGASRVTASLRQPKQGAGREKFLLPPLVTGLGEPASQRTKRIEESQILPITAS